MSVADDIQKLVQLRADGHLTDSQFEAAKSRVLAETSGHAEKPLDPVAVQPRVERGVPLKFRLSIGFVFFLALLVFITRSCDGPVDEGPWSREIPDGAVAVFVADETEYVYLVEPSSIGGACEGWNAISIQLRGQPQTGLKNIMCWMERDGNLRTAVREQVGTVVIPFSRTQP